MGKPNKRMGKQTEQRMGKPYKEWVNWTKNGKTEQRIGKLNKWQEN